MTTQEGPSNKIANHSICADWMARELVTAGPLDSVGHARELLQQHRINQLPIIEDGKLIGIDTDRDLRTKEYVPQSSRQIALEKVMTRDVITLEPASTLVEAATVLRHKRIGSVPIVDGGRLVGIVTRSDILDAFIGRKGKGRRHASADHKA